MKRINILIELDSDDEAVTDRFVRELRRAAINDPAVRGSNVFVEVEDVDAPGEASGLAP